MSYFGNQTVVEELSQGELVEAIEALRMAVNSLSRSVGQAMPDSYGRLLVNIAGGSVAIAASQTLANVTTVGNQTSLGGNPAYEIVPALMRLGVHSIRSNITVS